MIKKTLLLFVLLIVSCQQKEADATQSNPFTDNQKKIISWYNTAVKLRNRNHLQIITYADSILTNSKNENNTFKSLGYISYGIYYAAINNDSLCFQNYNEAFNLLKNSKNDSLLCRVHSGFGNYYKHTGDYPKSLKELMQALQLAEKLKDTVKMGGVYANLGQLYFQKDDQKQAKKYLFTSKNLLKNKKEKPPYLIAIHTLANINGMNGNFEEALKLDEEGLKICEKIKSNDLKATFLDNKANCYMFSNRLDSARYYFNECLKLDILGKNEKQISDSYANLAQLAVFCKNDAEVIQYTQKSLEIAKNVNYNPGIAKNYNLLIDFYKSKGDYKNAFEYSNKYQSVYKSLINEKKEIASAEFKAIYQTEKKEKELLISKAEIARSELEIKRKNTQFQILSLVSLALIAIGYLIYRQQKLKNQQQKQEFDLKAEIKEIETINKLQEQRLIISKDLQDGLGAQLTYIISSIDNLKFAKLIENEKVDNLLTKISNYTKSTFIELRDTIWAMKSSEYSFEDMKSRISNFTEKALEDKSNIDFKFIIDDDVKNTKLSLIVGINIYRSIQEAVNNAIKFAEASEIKVLVSKDTISITISIQDNGKGFDLESADYGSGIQNIEKRIEEIGGKFSISSVENQGTTILFSI